MNKRREVIKGFLMCFKHEFIKSVKSLWLAYSLLLASLIWVKWFSNIDIARLDDSPNAVAWWLIFFLISLSAYFILFVMRLVRAFWSEIFGDEGYLTLTLPVNLDAILLSKICVYVFWGMLYVNLIWFIPNLATMLQAMQVSVPMFVWTLFAGEIFNTTSILLTVVLLNAMRVRTFIFIKGLGLLFALSLITSIFVFLLSLASIHQTLCWFIIAGVHYWFVRYLIATKLELE